MNAEQITRTIIKKILVAYGEQVVTAVHAGDIYASQPHNEMIVELEKIAEGTAGAQLFEAMKPEAMAAAVPLPSPEEDLPVGEKHDDPPPIGRSQEAQQAQSDEPVQPPDETAQTHRRNRGNVR